MAWDIYRALDPVDEIDRMDVITLFDDNLDSQKSNPTVIPLSGDRPFDLKALYKLKKEMGKYDTVLIHNMPSSIYTKIVQNFVESDVILIEGSLFDMYPQKVKYLRNFTNSFLDGMICVSYPVYRSVVENQKRIEENKITTIESGVDINLVESISREAPNSEMPDGDVLITTAGMLKTAKNYEGLLRSYKLVTEQTSLDTNLIIIGGGPLQKNLIKLTEKLEITDSVSFTGMVERHEVYRILGSSDIYTQPSKREGLSLAALEAMATQNACVFSDLPVFTEPFDNNAAKYANHEKPEEIAKCILEFIRDDDLRQSHTQYSHEMIKSNYSLEKMGLKYQRFLNRIKND